MMYLDNNATTQPTGRVVESMLLYLTDCFFNPAAPNTAFTMADEARRQAADNMMQLLNAEDPSCFAFTSGATESNNWVFNDVCQDRRRGRIIISSIEHASVSEPAIALRDRGFEVIEIPVDENGVVNLSELAESLSADTVLVSVMAANNETGVLQPLDRIGQLVRENAPQARFHTDATQAIGKIAIDLQGPWSDVDLLSFSAHKFHGPKGVGGLYIRQGVDIAPMLKGGGQEGGLRSGTLNTPALAGMATAAVDVDLAAMDDVRRLRDEFEGFLMEALPGVVIHSVNTSRLPNTSAFSIPGVIGEEVVQYLAKGEIIVGAGSACSSGALHPPKTVLAIGTPYELAEGSLRVSLSAYDLAPFADRFIGALIRIVRN